MKRNVVAVGALTVVLAACATLNPFVESSAASRFDRGMRALERGDYAQATVDLGWVATHHADRSVGREALLVVAALEMDPRNPKRRLSLGADLTQSYLLNRGNEEWTLPIARTLHLLALELGAAEERVAAAEAERQRAEARLELPGPSVPERLKMIQDERDRLARRVNQLEQQLSTAEKNLAEKDKELERIRKTIKS